MSKLNLTLATNKPEQIAKGLIYASGFFDAMQDHKTRDLCAAAAAANTIDQLLARLNDLESGRIILERNLRES